MTAMLSVNAQPANGVLDALSSAGATLEKTATLGRIGSFALWRNDVSEAQYIEPPHHTVGFYLSGGIGTCRLDQRDKRGSPHTLCILPAGHESRWRIGGPLQLVHFYLDHQQLMLEAIRLLDQEPLALSLAEATYISDPAVAESMGQLARQLRSGQPDPLLMSSLAAGIQTELLLRFMGSKKAVNVSGKLSRVVRDRVFALIDHGVDAQFDLPIDALAEQAAMSAYHFSRLFKASVGLSPHQYVLYRRLEKVSSYLRAGMTIASASDLSGFSDVSHMHRHFVRQFGFTPGAVQRNR